MATNVIPNAEAFSFGSLTLHGNLQQLGDSDEQDIATHRPLKRNGAIIEGMGWNARRFEATCVYVGDNFRADVVNHRDAIRRKSQDVMVHPLYGRVVARCIRISGSLNIPAEANSTNVTYTFVEAGIDPKQEAVYAQLTTAKSQALSAALDDLETALAIYTATAAAFDDLFVVATAFADAAQTVADDPSSVLRMGLLTMPDQVAARAAILIAEIQADPAATEDVDRFDAMAATDLVYAAALELSDAIAQSGPVLIEYTVPATASYLSIAAALYGADGLGKADAMLSLNPEVTTPHLIPAGTVLTVEPATV